MIKTLLKNLPESSRLTQTSQELSYIEQMSPFFKAVVSPYLKDSHLAELKTVYSKLADEHTTERLLEGRITVGELEKIDLQSSRHEIIGIANKAYHEDLLLTMLKDLKSKWVKVVVPFGSMDHNPDIIGLINLQAFYDEVEEGLQTLNKLLSNKYAAIITKDAEDFQKTLQKTMEIVKRLSILQAKYVFFDGLFASPDMKKHLPSEGLMFDSTSKAFLSLLKKVELKNQALGLRKIPQIEDGISKLMTTFETLESTLDKYLETVRQKFSRLYLLSDTELLDLLSNYYADLTIFNKHLSKMFDSIASVKVSDDNSEPVIVGFSSFNNETISFPDSPFHLRGSLEEVLDQLLNIMKLRIKQVIFKKYEELLDATRSIDLEKYDFEKFCKDQVLQATLLSLDTYLNQLLVNSIGKGEEGFVDSILNTSLISRLASPRHREVQLRAGHGRPQRTAADQAHQLPPELHQAPRQRRLHRRARPRRSQRLLLRVPVNLDY